MYRARSSGSLPVRVRHRLGGRKELEGSPPERIAGFLPSRRRKWQDNHLHGFAATKRNVTQRNDAILRQNSFRAVCLHVGKIASLPFPRQLAKFLCGMASPAATRARLTRNNAFALLADLPFAEVLAIAEAA